VHRRIRGVAQIAPTEPIRKPRLGVRNGNGEQNSDGAPQRAAKSSPDDGTHNDVDERDQHHPPEDDGGDRVQQHRSPPDAAFRLDATSKSYR